MKWTKKRKNRLWFSSQSEVLVISLVIIFHRNESSTNNKKRLSMLTDNEGQNSNREQKLLQLSMGLSSEELEAESTRDFSFVAGPPEMPWHSSFSSVKSARASPSIFCSFNRMQGILLVMAEVITSPFFELRNVPWGHRDCQYEQWGCVERINSLRRNLAERCLKKAVKILLECKWNWKTFSELAQPLATTYTTPISLACTLKGLNERVTPEFSQVLALRSEEERRLLCRCLSKEPVSFPKDRLTVEREGVESEQKKRDDKMVLGCRLSPLLSGEDQQPAPGKQWCCHASSWLNFRYGNLLVNRSLTAFEWSHNTTLGR